jgi:molecular chaperone Hsp33
MPEALKNIELAGDDAIVPFQVDPLDVRGRAVQLGSLLDDVLGRHTYPEAVSKLLAEAIVLTSLLGSSMKFDGRFILQTQSEGPVSLLVVDFKTPHQIRAYARYEEADVISMSREEGFKPYDLLGKGILVMTVDQGQHMERYQGIVQLSEGGFEAVAEEYFKQSEQIPTVVRLAVAESLTHDRDADKGEEAKHGWRAGGMLAQFLPHSIERMKQADLSGGEAPEGADVPEVEVDDAWLEATALIGTIEPVELIDPNVPVERLLLRLFNEHGATVYPATAMEAKCSCSQAGIKDVLAGFTAEELAQSTEDGKISVNCEFCSTSYEFDPADFQN